MTKSRAWLLATRPATLLVGVAPVIVGAAIAQHAGRVRVAALASALLGAILIQIGANLANDVFDHERGADTAARVGPLRVTQAGLLSASEVRTGMVASFALATVSGLYLALVTGPTLVVVGVVSIAAAIAYTGGPWPFGYHGLGDLFVFVFFGLVAVSGTTLASHGSLVPLAPIAGIAMGALATAVLVVNNVRDRPTDAACGKRTLVVRFGHGFGAFEYGALLATAYLVPVGLVASGTCGPLVLLPLLTLPMAVRFASHVARRDSGPATLNRCLGGTAALLFVFALLFSLGLLFS